MNTEQAEYKTDIGRLSEQLAERDARLLLAVAGMIAFGVAVLGLSIRF